MTVNDNNDNNIINNKKELIKLSINKFENSIINQVELFFETEKEKSQKEIGNIKKQDIQYIAKAYIESTKESAFYMFFSKIILLVLFIFIIKSLIQENTEKIFIYIIIGIILSITCFIIGMKKPQISFQNYTIKIFSNYVKDIEWIKDTILSLELDLNKIKFDKN